MRSVNRNNGGCSNFGHLDEAGSVGKENQDQTKESGNTPDVQAVDAMLQGLVGVVVDELILLENEGMTPAEIRRLYSDTESDTKECGK